MLPMPSRSRLLRFPEGTLLNNTYMLVSPGHQRNAGSRAAGGANGSGIEAESADDPPSSWPQRRVPADHYVVPLGQGGSSVVFLARQVIFAPDTGPRSVARAVKFYLLSPTLARRTDPRSMQTANTRSMQNEIEHLTSVQHASILKVIDAGVCTREGAAVNYLVTDYVPGPTLADVLDCGTANRATPLLKQRGAAVYRQIRRSPTLILQILEQLCGAIEHLHGQNIYHCDIAPKNIFIHPPEEYTAGYRPILGDFALGWQPGRQPDRRAGFSRIDLGGAMRYAPPAHNQLRCTAGCAAGLREFSAYAAYWDIYGFAKSALELVELAPRDSAAPWKQALRHYLREALVEANGVTAARLHKRITKLL
ncbi:MAG: protein kinase family protein [Caldilineaceae bacterium]